MAFIDELAKRFGEVVKKVGEKSEQLVELGKVNYELFKEEDAIKRLYREIGEAVYEAYKQENKSLDAIYRLCKEIDEHKEKIEGLKKQVDSLKKEAQMGYTEEKIQAEAHQAAADDGQGSDKSSDHQNINQDASEGKTQNIDREKAEGNDEKYLQEGI